MAVVVLVMAQGITTGQPVAIGPWRLAEGLYRVAGAGQNLLYLADEPHIVEEGAIEATVVVEKRVRAGGWATAGLLLTSAPGSFWNLGLVEDPDGQHCTELVENYQGVNQAQSDGGSAQWCSGLRGSESACPTARLGGVCLVWPGVALATWSAR